MTALRSAIANALLRLSRWIQPQGGGGPRPPAPPR